MAKKFDQPRWKIVVDGKWQGGSFASKAEADAVAKKLLGKDVEVLEKGAKPKSEKK